MKHLFLLLVLTSTVLCCGTEELTPPQEVFIRIENASDFAFNNILVKTSEDHDYGNLNAGELSEYQEHERAFSYAYVELEADGETYVIQPIDFIGETELAGGNYTYILSLDESSERLLIALRED